MNDVNLTKLVTLAVFRLFKSLPKAKILNQNTDFNKIAITHGLFISPDADFTAIDDIKDEILSYGITTEQMNQTFHKSLKVVAESTDEELFFHQILNYITTYGVESLGFKVGEICDVYIPNEVLNLPEDSDSVKITVIGSISDDEIRQRLKSLSEKNIAYSKNVLDDIILLSKSFNVDLNVDSIANKELRVRVCTEFNKVPSNPQQFLRFLNFIVLNDSLFIKNEERLNSLWSLNKVISFRYDANKASQINKSLNAYIEKYGFKPLAEIFYQHKKMWLILKNKGNATIINKIRKLADKYKKPFKKGVLDRLTNDSNIELSEIQKELKKVSLGKKVSAYNAMTYRQNYPESITYHIRNGKMFFKELDKTSRPEVFNTSKAKEIMDLLYNSIVESIRDKVEGKVIYIPDTIHYAFPTSEKDFISGIPCGSVAHLGKSAIVGVFWENYKDDDDEIRIDLDLHMYSQDGEYGWDSNYRSGKRDILFTGDMTNAPIGQGATESFYLGETAKGSYAFNLNYFNKDRDVETLKYKLILDAMPVDAVDAFSRNYIMDKKTMLTCVNMELKSALSTSQNIGIICDCNGCKNFVFYNYSLGMNSTCVKDEDDKKMIVDSLKLQCATRLSLNNVLKDAGAEITDRYVNGCIDLSLNGIAPTTIVELLF